MKFILGLFFAFELLLAFAGCSTQHAALEEKSQASKPSPVVVETPKSTAGDSKKNINPAKSADEIDAAQNSLIGIIKTPPTDGLGCYMVLPADINKNSDNRRYVFIGEDDGGAVMNLDGIDVPLKNDKSDEVKSVDGKKRFVWIYSDGTIKVTLNLTQTKTSNDGENSQFDAVIKADKGGRIYDASKRVLRQLK